VAVAVFLLCLWQVCPWWRRAVAWAAACCGRRIAEGRIDGQW